MGYNVNVHSYEKAIHIDHIDGYGENTRIRAICK
jgi:hypothetical protein